MIKRILNYSIEEDKKILQSKSKDVLTIDDNIKQLIQDMKDTLHSTNGGRGISAVQIGELKRICICNWDEEIIMINPYITRSRGNQEFKEGCLSVPGKIVSVPRAQKVWCTYTDENGEQKEIAQGGRMSNIIQHELDHFEGICRILGDE